jgi:decaprenylphospho-beta-D-erythro-pentofuranosid-2-ulose 2-reductase
MRTIAIIGATSLIAQNCAKQWCITGDVHFILVGRSLHKLNIISTNLLTKNIRLKIDLIEDELINPPSIEYTVNKIFEKCKTVSIVLIAQGYMPPQSTSQKNLSQAMDVFNINGASPALFAEAFAAHMEKIGRGTIAIIGSISGDRGRKSNYIYGSAKGMISRYAQGLQHRFAGTDIHIVLIKPGPTETPMTENLILSKNKLANPESVAKTIVKGISDGKTTIYVPTKWVFLMRLIQHMPNFIFNRLNI